MQTTVEKGSTGVKRPGEERESGRKESFLRAEAAARTLFYRSSIHMFLT